jgi:serine/threonine protein kinase
MIDQTISHYRIIEKLGRGGMGEVYLAEDKRLDRKVAIKFLPAEVATDERAKQRLLREAKTAATLDHQNICAIYEVGQEGDYSFIVLQYIEGETLASKLKRHLPDLRETLAIAAQVADALNEAHARGIIHRDIKPENIMLTTRNQGHSVRATTVDRALRFTGGRRGCADESPLSARDLLRAKTQVIC